MCAWAEQWISEGVLLSARQTRHTPQLRPAPRHTWSAELHKPREHGHIGVWTHTHKSTRTHTVDVDTAGSFILVSLYFGSFLALRSLLSLEVPPLFSHLWIRVLLIKTWPPRLSCSFLFPSFALILILPSVSILHLPFPLHTNGSLTLSPLLLQHSVLWCLKVSVIRVHVLCTRKTHMDAYLTGEGAGKLGKVKVTASWLILAC